MADQKIRKLTKLATGFRQMIENADWSKLTIEFEDFPVGSCGDASILLAQYLIDSGYDTPTYVSAELVTPTGLPGHAWIELNGLIIDITADGFDPKAPKVIVEANSEWHEKFEILDKHAVGISMYQQDHIVRNLLAAYHELVGLRVH